MSRWQQCSRRGRKYRVASFDDLVGAGEQRSWHGEAECFGGVEIDYQLIFRRLLDRELGRFLPCRILPV
jgi:hypothetical protein